MRRLVIVAGLFAGLAVPAATTGSEPKPTYFWGSVAATVKGPGQPSLAEVVRPSLIFIFADGSWDVDHLHWSGWGSSSAHAKGISSASNGIPNQAEGKRIKHAARVTLSHPGQFDGHRVYRCFKLTVPSHHASDQYLCLRGHAGYYNFVAV